MSVYGYEVEVVGVSREVYFVQADSEQEARDNWTDGIRQLAEVSDVEVVGVMEVDA